MPDPVNADLRIMELELQLKEAELRDKTSGRPLFRQTFLTALPIILTIGLGFLANYVQSLRQHDKQLEVIQKQGDLDRLKQSEIAEDAGKARLEEANRTFTVQERDAKSQSERQEREFAANSAAAEKQFAAGQQTLRMQNAAQQAQQAREFAQSLERQRQQSEVEIIIKAGEVPTSLSPEQQDVLRARNLLWFADAGFIRVPERLQTTLRGVAKVAEGESISVPILQTSGNTRSFAVKLRPEEAAKVADFQRKHGLVPDGIISRETCKAVEAEEEARPGTTIRSAVAICLVHSW